MEQGKLLITGGTGFFGKALLRHFLLNQNNNQVPTSIVLLSRNPDLFLKKHPEFKLLKSLELRFGDITLPQTLPNIAGITHVIHAATDSTVGPFMEPLERYRQIVHGTENILAYAVRCGARRFLLTSSGGVYGEQPEDVERLPETWLGMPDPLNPANAYSVAKRAAEHLCALYRAAYGLETVIARCFAFVGEDLPLNVHFAIGNFVRDALWADEITVGGDGKSIRSYLDQRDLAEWLLGLLANGQSGNAYNVGSDRSISVAALANLVGKLISPAKTVRIMGNVNEARQRSIYVPDISKARRELGLTVTVQLEQAISDTASAAYRNSECRFT